MAEDDESDADWGEVTTTFTGCTCDHEPFQHGWGSCDVDDCECDGGWEE